MARATQAQRAERVRTAQELLTRGTSMVEAAVALSRDFGLSRRQAYRYLEEAQAVASPPVVAEASVTKQTGRWERSTVWGILRNPAYKGAAGFGKTQTAPRQRITRPLRLRGGIASRDSAHHERPQDEWIAIPVPLIADSGGSRPLIPE